jgi:hypothetical protein
MFEIIRIVVLLLILATVAQQAWLSRSRAIAWTDSLRVAIYPNNGDGSPASAAYLNTLSADSFRGIARWFEEEAKRHGRTIHRPLDIAVAPPLADRPPQPPAQASAFDSILWSLRMRYWAWRHDAVPGMKPQVRLFVLYFDPAQHERLPHSVGIDRGMLGIVNAFAGRAQAGSNSVVITHELLHTLGATDKYDLANGQPTYPDGYAEPARNPRHPQSFAEIMGGRIPIGERHAEIPESLDDTLIGGATAREIGWAGR